MIGLNAVHPVLLSVQSGSLQRSERRQALAHEISSARNHDKEHLPQPCPTPRAPRRRPASPGPTTRSTCTATTCPPASQPSPALNLARRAGDRHRLGLRQGAPVRQLPAHQLQHRPPVPRRQRLHAARQPERAPHGLAEAGGQALLPQALGHHPRAHPRGCGRPHACPARPLDAADASVQADRSPCTCTFRAATPCPSPTCPRGHTLSCPSELGTSKVGTTPASLSSTARHGAEGCACGRAQGAW